jgi:hypothetical protein
MYGAIITLKHIFVIWSKHELQKHVQNITPRQLLETAIRNIWTEIPIYYIQDAYASEASN